MADKATWLATLELVAAIQIVQVEFADVDLLIIPSRVLIDVVIGDEPNPKCVQLPDNNKLAWRISMPNAMMDTQVDEYHIYLVSVVLMVLGQATALPVSQLDQLIEKRMERGLPGRIFSVRPLRELMNFLRSQNVQFR